MARPVAMSPSTTPRPPQPGSRPTSHRSCRPAAHRSTGFSCPRGPRGSRRTPARTCTRIAIACSPSHRPRSRRSARAEPELAPGTRMVLAPRGVWTFGVIDTPAGLAAIAVRRGGDTCWFAWHGTSVEQLRPAHIAIATRTRGQRWIDDVRMLVYDIHRELDRGPWLRYVRGPAPFDDTSIGSSIVIGRDGSCELRLLDILLSRRHAVFGLGERLEWLVDDAG